MRRCGKRARASSQALAIPPPPPQARPAVYFRTAAPRSFPLADATQLNVARRPRLRPEAPRGPAPSGHLKSLRAEEGGDAKHLGDAGSGGYKAVLACGVGWSPAPRGESKERLWGRLLCL